MSLAGHDKGSFLVVMKAENGLLTLCDGKQRSLENPKVKKEKHVAATLTVLPEVSLETNRKIRSALGEYRSAQTRKDD